MTASAFDTTIDVNLKGTFLVCQAVGRIMLAQGAGKIINLASQAASVALDEHVAYCASKFGVVGLTKVLASEWAGRGVTVNTISPTVVLTDLGRKAWAGPKGEALKARSRPAGSPCRRRSPRRRSSSPRSRGHGQRRRPAGRRGLHHPLSVAPRRIGR